MEEEISRLKAQVVEAEEQLQEARENESQEISELNALKDKNLMLTQMLEKHTSESNE